MTTKKKTNGKKVNGRKNGNGKKPRNYVSSVSTAKKKEIFLNVFKRTGNVSYAAHEAGIHRTTHHKIWMKDPEYAAQFASAREEAVDVLEHEALRRAVQGVEEPVFYQGEVCGHVRKHSDTLLIFLLKGNRPEKFRERYEHAHTGKDGAELSFTIKIDDNRNRDI